jgi:hypothetical protein
MGLKTDEEGEADNIKAGDWVKTRVRQNLDKAVPEGREDKVVINGVKAKYYN